MHGCLEFLSDLLPATDGLNLGSASLTRRWNIPAVKNITMVTNLNADRLDGLHRTGFTTFLGLVLAYFSPTEVSVGAETTLIEKIEWVDASKSRFFIPSFSAYYRWTDLAGGNPTCTLKFYFGKGAVGDEFADPVYTAKNFVEFQGVDLFKHPVALVRSILDSSDFMEYAGGMSNRNVGLKVTAVTSAGTVAFGDNSLSGIYAEKWAV